VLPGNHKEQDTAVSSNVEEEVIIVGTPTPSTPEVTIPNA